MPSMPVSFQPIDSLVPYARNSRTHSDAQVAQLAASIEEFGWTNPVLADDKGIVAGHGRVLAARMLYTAGHFIKLPGGEAVPAGTVPVIDCTGWSEAKRRAYVIADNKLAMNAGWDDEALAAEIEALAEEGYDLSLLGFSSDELAEIAALGAEREEHHGDPDDAPEPPDEPITRPGDVWICGKHRVMCGDSTSIEAVEALCQGQPVDQLLTDPPYNVAYEGKTKDALKIKNDAMENGAFRQFLRDAFTAASAVMKPGAVFYIWHADLEGYNFRGACMDAGWQVRQCLVWAKQVMVMGRQDYHWKHEPCLYGWKDGAAHLWASDRKQTTVLEFDRPTRSAEHPTMKPVALFEYQLLNNTKPGDIVLDGFGGSGTTMIAAEKNGRAARLMELDPRYVDVIVRRWQTFTGKAATLESDGRVFELMGAERTAPVAA